MCTAPWLQVNMAIGGANRNVDSSCLPDDASPSIFFQTSKSLQVRLSHSQFKDAVSNFQQRER